MTRPPTPLSRPRPGAPADARTAPGTVPPGAIPPGGRDTTLDVLRGLAIVAMVLGHVAVELTEPPGAFWMEAFGGVAPALFLVLVGMVVAHSRWRKGRTARHFLRRGALVLGTGVLIDVLFWRIVPFTTVDVLYLIGISIPIAALVASRVPPAGRWALAAVLILAAPPLQDRLGYADYPTEIGLDGRLVTEVDLVDPGIVPIVNRTGPIRHWIVDGWFPVFPWLGFALLGVAFAGWRTGGASGGAGPPRRTTTRAVLVPGLALIAVAIALGWMDPTWVLTPRLRFGGAFMPPRYDYLTGSVGEILVLAWLVDRVVETRLGRSLTAPVTRLGQGALIVYVMHQPLIRLATKLWGHRVGALALIGTTAAILAVLALGLEGLARVRRRRPASRAATGRTSPRETPTR